MEFLARKNKSKVCCCVNGCTSKACRDEEISFFHFPPRNKQFVYQINKFGEKKIIDRHIAWVQALNIKKSITRSMRVCSLHFIKNDFLPSTIDSTRSHLKKISVPSQNLPLGSSKECSYPIEQIDSQEERILGRSIKKELVTDNDIEKLNLNEKKGKKRKKDQGDKNEEEEKDDDGNEKEISNNINCIGPQTISGSTKKNALFLKKCKSIGIQVQSDLMIPKFSSSIASKEELSTLTGIPTFEVLNLLEELVVTVGPKHKTSSRFDLREMILMTFMMLKQNLSYAVLAIFFKCSKDICKDIIFDMINNLNLCLKPVIYWPTKYNILKNMPKCFRGFENVRVVIDCTEVRIQKPSKLCCQLQTYSNYKSTYTVKFMTGMTPAGLISFVSKPYGGRISDNMIFEQSNLLKKMDKKDALLANRGLTVDNLCKEYDVTFISPIFLGDKTQFSKTESLLNHNVAKAFVHIERCKQQLKCFNILNDKMPMCLLSKVEEIFNVICGLVNLSAPILKNDEFFS